MMAIRPVGERVLAVEAPTDTIHKSGLILPEHLDRVKMAIVVELGGGLALEALDLSPGDVIYFQEGSENRIKDNLIVEAAYIIAIERNN